MLSMFKVLRSYLVDSEYVVGSTGLLECYQKRLFYKIFLYLFQVLAVVVRTGFQTSKVHIFYFSYFNLEVDCAGAIYRLVS